MSGGLPGGREERRRGRRATVAARPWRVVAPASRFGCRNNPLWVGASGGRVEGKRPPRPPAARPSTERKSLEPVDGQPDGPGVHYRVFRPIESQVTNVLPRNWLVGLRNGQRVPNWLQLRTAVTELRFSPYRCAMKRFKQENQVRLGWGGSKFWKKRISSWSVITNVNDPVKMGNHHQNEAETAHWIHTLSTTGRRRNMATPRKPSTADRAT